MNLFSFISPDPPSAPDAPLVDEIFATTCRLQWSPPSSDGGSPITGYVIERRLKGATRWSKVTKHAVAPDTTQITVDELIEGSEYEFRVTACNKVAESEPSAPSPMIVAKNPFGKLSIRASDNARWMTVCCLQISQAHLLI
jgi:hypothetical protein